MSAGSRDKRNVAYLVLSHHQPHRVEALAQRILDLSPRATVFVHHDAKADDLPWSGGPPTGVRLVAPRVSVSWGRWSQVEAMLATLEFARRSGDFSWFVIISGQDWPRRHLARWEEELECSGADAFLDAHRAVRTDGAAPPGGDEYLRYNHRWFVLARPDNWVLRKGTSTIGYGLARMTLPVREQISVLKFYGRGWACGIRRQDPLPEGWDYFKGSALMTLGRRATDVLLDHPLRQPLSDHFRHTLMPDEGFIPTILANAPGLSVANAPTTFAPWEKWRFDLVLLSSDIEDVQRAGTPFARKVDPARDAAVVPLIDAMVDAEFRQPTPAPDPDGRPRGASFSTLGPTP